jgi:hypothetical protein
MAYQETVKLVTNLDRGAIEAKLADVRRAAEAQGLTALASLFSGVEGMPRAKMEQCVANALRWLADKPQYNTLFAQLELVELNLPNLK